MSKVNDENYIVIQGFMVNDLELKGNELLIYAIIYGFSQDENQKFTGSLQYLADWTNSTKQGVLKNLKTLIDKGFVDKEEKIINGVKFVEYYATKFNGVLNKVEWGIKQSLTNNIYNNIDNKIDNNIKHKYGEYKNVLLKDDELEKLKKEYPNYEDLIKYLDEYIEMKGYKAKSHYLCIKKWVVDAVKNGKNIKKRESNFEQRQYDDLSYLYSN